MIFNRFKGTDLLEMTKPNFQKYNKLKFVDCVFQGI